MNKNELKLMLKPLVKQLVKEAIKEELSSVISEIIKQTSSNVVVESKQQTKVDDSLQKEKLAQKQKILDEKRKLLEEVSKKAYGGINIFEGTTPIGSAGNPEQTISERKVADPLSDTDPSDPGVDIGGLLRMTGGWKQIK